MRKAPLSALERRIPTNPKFANVKSKLNTGNTVDKVKVISTKEFLRKRNELFFRVSPSSLYELLTEYQGCEGGEGTVEMSSMSGGPKMVVHQADEAPKSSAPFVLLDIRSTTEYHTGHILSSVSFPARMVKQDKWIKEIYANKNKEGVLIIVYGDEEKESSMVATTLVEKGVENIFVLSGGFVTFSERFPMLVEGEAPEPRPTPRGISSSSSSTSRSQVGGRGTPRKALPSSSGREGYSTARSGARTSREPALISSGKSHQRADYQKFRKEADDIDDSVSVAESTMSTMSVADSIISKAATKKKYY